MLLKLLALASVWCLDKVKSEYECFNRTIDGKTTERTVPVSFKNGSRIELEMELSNTTRLHIDFEGTNRHVVLRISFTNDSTSATITVKSLRLKEVTTTVGTIDQYRVNIPESERIKLGIQINENSYSFTLDDSSIVNGANGNDSAIALTSLKPSRRHYILYQTTRRIYIGTFPYLALKICNLPDACAGVCLTCPGGSYLQPTTDATTIDSNHYNSTHSCVECGVGSYSNDNNLEECSLCPAGEYNEKEDDTSCTQCKKGTYSSEPGAKYNKSCINCSLGTYSEKAGASSCLTCPTDRITDRNEGATSCEECPDEYPILINATDCGYCAPGAKIHDVSCVPCPAGSYSSENNSLTCATCIEGTYQDKEGSTECNPCAAGSSQHQKGATSCTLCQSSTYQPESGQPVCLYCHGTVNDNACLQNVFECLATRATYANVGSLAWTDASSGQVLEVPCPHGGTATRTCYKNSWLPPDLTHCNSPVTEKVEETIVNLADKDAEEVTSAINTLINEDIEQFAPKDIDKITQILDGVNVTVTQVAEVMLGSAVQLIGYNSDLEEVVPSTTKNKVVSLVDKSVSYLAGNGNAEDIAKHSTQHISINVIKNGSTFKQPGRAQTVSISQATTFSAVVYHNTKLFTVDKGSDLLTSEILSVALHGEPQQQGFQVDLQMEVTLTGTAECRWFDTERSTWSTAGCYITSRTGEYLNCQCDHLTSFAVFTSLNEVPESHRHAQSLLTTLLFILSIITCLITLAVYLPIRALRNKVVIRVEMMEISALILANVTFLILSHAQHQSKTCAGLVFALQYFYLVTIAWSFVAAWTFYRQIVNAIHTYGKTYQHTFVVSFILCWTLPLIFPSFALIYSQQHGLSYLADINGEFGCWMSETWKTYTFILPILITVTVNTILGLRVIYVMLRAKTKKVDSWDTYKRHIKSIISLLTIFGTSFLLALFTYGPHAIVFQYLFICFTCSQGLFIFVLFVPLRPEVHSEWKGYLTRSSTSRLSSPRMSRTESTSIFPRQLLKRMSSTLLPYTGRRDTPEETAAPKNGKIDE